MSPTAVFLMLEGPQVLGSAARRARPEDRSHRVVRDPTSLEPAQRAARDARLSADAIWLLLEGSRGPATSSVDRAA